MVATSAGVSKRTVLMKSCSDHADHHRREEGDKDRGDEAAGPGSLGTALASASRRPA